MTGKHDPTMGGKLRPAIDTRARGEDAFDTSQSTTFDGTSPYVWGRLNAELFKLLLAKVHPRACGEILL